MTSARESHTNQDEAAGSRFEEIEIPNRLGRIQRLVATLVATTAGGAGGIAVFATDNGAGSVALLALGALFGIVALSGRSLASAKFGDNEVIFDKALRQSVARRIAEAPPQVAAELAEALVEADAEARQPLVSSARRLLYEQAVADALRDIANDVSMEFRDLTRVADAGADFQLLRNNRPIDVMIKRLVAHQTIPPSWIVSGGTPHPVLIVAREAHRGAVDLLERRQGTRVVTWDSPRDNDSLRRAVEDLAGELRDPPI